MYQARFLSGLLLLLFMMSQCFFDLFSLFSSIVPKPKHRILVFLAMKRISYMRADFPYFCLKSALLLFAWCRLLLSIAFLQFLRRVLPPPLSVTLVCTTAPAQYIPSYLLSTHLSYPLSPSSALLSSAFSVF